MMAFLSTLRLPIIKDTDAEKVLSELVEFSKKKENWFNDPNQSAEAAKAERKRTDPRPEGGHHAPHTRHITLKVGENTEETYHVSFTITQAQMAPGGDLSQARDVLLRHATIGVGKMDRLIDEIEAFTITRFLGFKKQELQGTRHPDFPAVVLFEVIPPEEVEKLQAG